MSGGRDHKARGLAPPQRSHEPPSPSLTRKGAGREKGPGQWERGLAPQSPLHTPPAGPCNYLFHPPLQMGSLTKLSGGILPPPHKITAFFFLFAPFTPFLALRAVEKGKVGLRDRPVWGDMICPHPPPANASISLPAPPTPTLLHWSPSQAGSRR